MVQAIHQTTEILQLLFDFRWSMPLLCGLCCFSFAAVETFLALPQLQLVEKSSPVFPDCSKLRTFRSCSSSTSSSTSLSCRKRRSSWSRLFSRLQSFHSCSTFQVLDAPVVLVVLCSSWLLQAKIFGILAGMDQKDSYCGMYNTGYAGYDAPRAVFRPGLQAHAARHHGLFGPKACGSGMCKAGIAGFHALRAVFPGVLLWSLTPPSLRSG